MRQTSRMHCGAVSSWPGRRPEQAVADVSINIAGQEYSYMEWNSEVENGMEQSLYTVTRHLICIG